MSGLQFVQQLVHSKVFFETSSCSSFFCLHSLCIWLCFTSATPQRSFQLEDANDIEIRQLKEKVASMTTENQTATAKVQQQDEQSEEE